MRTIILTSSLRTCLRRLLRASCQCLPRHRAGRHRSQAMRKAGCHLTRGVGDRCPRRLYQHRTRTAAVLRWTSAPEQASCCSGGHRVRWFGPHRYAICDRGHRVGARSTRTRRSSILRKAHPCPFLDICALGSCFFPRRGCCTCICRGEDCRQSCVFLPTARSKRLCCLHTRFVLCGLLEALPCSSHLDASIVFLKPALASPWS
jgi:hypothetical protein